MTTIKIKPSHPSQGEYVVINKADFDTSKHELHESEDLGDSGAGDGIPTMAELLAARDQLLEQKNALDDRELQLNQRSDVLTSRELGVEEREGAVSVREQAAMEREQANEAEAQRLVAEKAALATAATEKASTKKASA